MKTYGLIGKSLGHSFSKGYFTDKFAKNDIQAEYKNFELENINLLIDTIKKNETLKGLNVTIPYKEEVLPLLNEIDDTAKAIGAVNTIKITQNNRQLNLKGFNTDAFGFKQSIKPFLASQHENALILGTGGASKAVEFVLKEIGINVHFVSRTIKDGNYLTYDQLNEIAIKHFKLIVNCTPLGTFPNIKDKPSLPYNSITKQHLLYDLIYNPEQTEFLRLGKEKNALTVNGLSMLKHQAEKAWKIWNS